MLWHPVNYLVRARRHEHNRNRLAAANFVDRIDSATWSQFDISGYQIRSPVLCRSNGIVFAYGKVEGGEAALAQRILNRNCDEGFVFNYQGVDRASPFGSTMVRLQGEATSVIWTIPQPAALRLVPLLWKRSCASREPAY